MEKTVKSADPFVIKVVVWTKKLSEKGLLPTGNTNSIQISKKLIISSLNISNSFNILPKVIKLFDKQKKCIC